MFSLFRLVVFLCYMVFVSLSLSVSRACFYVLVCLLMGLVA